MKIGVVDSGVGGFSVLRELKRLMPADEYYYLSDYGHAPYGDKDTAYLRQRLHVLVDELLKENVAMIVVACHTATAEAIESLRQDYSIPFIGIEPYLNVLNNPDYKEKEFVVLMTQTTAKSQRFHALRERLDPKHILNLYACTHLASLIEKFYHDEINESDFSKQIENELAQVCELKVKFPKLTTAILGCTHYPLIAQHIERVTGLEVLFPGDAIARRAQSIKSQLAPTPQQSILGFFYYRRRPADSWQQVAWSHLEKFSS